MLCFYIKFLDLQIFFSASLPVPPKSFARSCDLRISSNNYDNLGVAHPQSGSSSHISGRIGIQLEPLLFEERGSAEYPEKNLSEQRREPTKDS